MKSEEIFLQYEREVAEFKLKLIRKLTGSATTTNKTQQKRTSNIAMIETILKDAGKPLHVNDIITAVQNKFDIALDRDSISSAIIKQVRKKKKFERTAPNTFSLK